MPNLMPLDEEIRVLMEYRYSPVPLWKKCGKWDNLMGK